MPAAAIARKINGMTSSLAPSCPLTASPNDEPDCSRRLLLVDCLARWQREARHGEVDTGRYRCRHVVWGTGPTLVLIPGLASDAISFVMLMARLSTYFRCVSYELPDGVADGARLTTYRHDDLTSDLFAMLDHLRLRECFLLGYSFGSTITLSALHQQPQRFPRAILQGGFARRKLSSAERFVVSWARYLPGRLGHLPLMERVCEYNHHAPYLEREPDVWRFFLERTGRVPLRAFAHRVRMLPPLDLRPLLPAIPTPLLLLCGDRDPLVGKTCERELLQGLPALARAEIEKCGHHPHLTHPEVAAEVVRQFLLPAPCGV